MSAKKRSRTHRRRIRRSGGQPFPSTSPSTFPVMSRDETTASGYGDEFGEHRQMLQPPSSSSFEERMSPRPSFRQQPPPPPMSQPQTSEMTENQYTSTTATPAPAPAEPTGFFGRMTNGLRTAKSKLYNWIRGVPNQTSGGGRRTRRRTRTRRSKRRHHK
jgi:hypothetical protein